jgi:hypothetical protein
MARITVSPETFTMVAFGAPEVAAIAEEVADRIGLPADVQVSLEVDEVLPSPLCGSSVDVEGGSIRVWITGGELEDPQRLRQLSEDHARQRLGIVMMRAADRLRDELRDAPADEQLTDAQRAIWETSAEGRMERLGYPVQKPRRQYLFRLSCGFTDVADEEFERLWDGAPLSWEGISSLAERLAEADPRPRPKRQVAAKRETLRAS